MTTTWDMSGKKNWNFFAFGSVADAFDAITKEYGAKQDWGTIACFLVLQLDDEQRRQLKRMLGIAEVESQESGDLLLEMRKLFQKPLTIQPTQEGGVKAGPSGGRADRIVKQGNQMVQDRKNPEPPKREKNQRSVG